MSKNETPQKRPRAKLITQHEFVLLEKHMEPGGGISLTVPDEALTIREIMKRFVTMGRVPDTLHREGFYDDNPDFDSPDSSAIARSDIFDKSEILKFEKERSEQLKKQITEGNRKPVASKATEKPKDDKGGASAASDDVKSEGDKGA